MKKTTLMKTLTISLLTAAFWLAGAAGGAAAQATFTVTKTADTNGTCVSGVNCSLREAIAAANAVATNDTINFAIPANGADCAGGVCTITLTLGELAVNNAGNLTITNAGGTTGIVVSGNNTSRVFFVNSGANLTLNNLTVTRGNGTGTTDTRFNGFGGGIVIRGTLTMTNSTVSGNSASQGGGIYNQGTLTVTNSTISGNSAQGIAGGIYNDGTLTVTNSTVSGNNSAQIGGGIFNTDGTLTVTNSTISGNSAQSIAGGIYNNGTLTVTNSTVSSNSAQTGSGIYNEKPFDTPITANLGNTIVAANTATGSAPDFSGTITSQGYNLIGNNSGATITGTTTGNQIGTSANPINPLLAPLANNGGQTQTRALQTGSPAIDKGNSTLTTDQRGFTRPIDDPNSPNGTGNLADIGAFEVQAPTAAGVSVSGRVLIGKRGLTNATVYLTNQNGETLTSRTTAFGYYHFDDVEAGQNAILTVVSKRYRFEPKVINLTEDLTNFDFNFYQSPTLLQSELNGTKLQK